MSLARMPSLSSFLPGAIPGVPFSTMKAEMPLVAGGAIGDRHHDHHVADAAVRREGLRSVQHPARARARRRRAHAAASLPEVDSVSPHAPIFSPRASGARNCLLRLGAEQEDVRGAEAVVRRHRQRDARIDARELFDADAVVDRRHAGAAVLLGELNAQQAERRQLRHQFDRKVLRLVPLADVGPDFGFRELAHAAAQQLLLFGRTEVHEHSNSISSGELYKRRALGKLERGLLRGANAHRDQPQWQPTDLAMPRRATRLLTKPGRPVYPSVICIYPDQGASHVGP